MSYPPSAFSRGEYLFLLQQAAGDDTAPEPPLEKVAAPAFVGRVRAQFQQWRQASALKRALATGSVDDATVAAQRAQRPAAQIASPDYPLDATRLATPSSGPTTAWRPSWESPAFPVPRQAPQAGVTRQAPQAGVTRQAPQAGVTRQAPQAGVTRQAPQAGVTRQAPQAGVTQQVPQAGVTQQVPVTDGVTRLAPVQGGMPRPGQVAPPASPAALPAVVEPGTPAATDAATWYQQALAWAKANRTPLAVGAGVTGLAAGGYYAAQPSYYPKHSNATGMPAGLPPELEAMYAAQLQQAAPENYAPENYAPENYAPPAVAPKSWQELTGASPGFTGGALLGAGAAGMLGQALTGKAKGRLARYTAPVAWSLAGGAAGGYVGHQRLKASCALRALLRPW